MVGGTVARMVVLRAAWMDAQWAAPKVVKKATQ
jgi:hypothetical protein